MIKIQRMGHATIETLDLEKSLDYYVNVNGLIVVERGKNVAYLISKIGELTIALYQSARADCTRLSFEVSASSDFIQMQKFLDTEGINSEVRNDPFPGVESVLSFYDQNGIGLDIYKNRSFIAPTQNVPGIGPLKVGHVAFYSGDVYGSVKFYEKILGFRVSDWLSDFFVFMRCNPDHHTVNFFKASRTQLHHIAFELKDFAHIQQSCEILSLHQIPLGWGPLRQGGPGHNVAAYHRNPDDQVVEYYCELDQMKNEELGYFEPRPWHTDRPQRPRTWDPNKLTTGWGTPPAASYSRPIP